MTLMIPSAGGVELLKRQVVGRGLAISAATNASPTVITSNSHGLANGNAVTIAGAVGNTAINGTFCVGSVASNTFQIYPTSGGTGGTAVNGNGAFSGTCYWTLAGMENCAVKLFSSNTTPAESDTASTYTEVSNGSGYTTGGQTLQSLLAASSGNVWALPATVSGGGTGGWALSLGSGSTNVPETTATQLSWSWSGSVTSYGYFVVGLTSTTIWFSQAFGAAKNFSSGDSLTLTNRLGLTHS
jgi:hypothetical protein